MTRLIVLLLLFITITSSAYAGWTGPETVVAGRWGSGEGEFGFAKDYIEITLPHFIIDDKTGNVLVADVLNEKIKIYSADGRLVSSFGPTIHYNTNGHWPERLLGTYDGKIMAEWGRVFQTYSNDGIVTSSFEQDDTRVEMMLIDGRVVLFNYGVPNKRYEIYSPTGELLTTNDKKPLELGIKTARHRDNKYDTTVQFEDITYHVNLDGDWDNFVRDRNNYLYFFYRYTAKDSVSGEDSLTSLVVKYDPCGKLIDRFDLPISEYEKPSQKELDMPTTTPWVRNEYGPPVIGPDGSIYAWKRTPDTYNILKWTWVDDPSDPKDDCPK